MSKHEYIKSTNGDHELEHIQAERLLCGQCRHCGHDAPNHSLECLMAEFKELEIQDRLGRLKGNVAWKHLQRGLQHVVVEKYQVEDQTDV
jgi:hypothetical protein